MAKSKIDITFNSTPLIGDYLQINNDLSAINISEQFQATRVTNGYTVIGLNKFDTALNYYNAISLDYNGSGLYSITITGNIVTIYANQDNVVFSVFTNNTSGRISTTITNEVVAPTIEISALTYSEATTDPTNNVKVSVTTSELATSVSSPVVIDPNTLNPFTFEVLRGVTKVITCTSASGTANKTITTPDILSIGNVSISLFNTPSGGNATINVTNVSGLTLQYSLDNVTFQSSNVFNGLIVGSYTIYVKDQLGVTVSEAFDVTVFTPNITLTSAFSYLSKEMSIRFKKNVVWDNFSNYRTEDNTLSCEEKIENAYPFYHKFQTVDIITTQFLSNYSDISANIIKEDGSKDAITINKKSNNLDIKDYRDATYYKYSDTQLGIYFTSGDTYDYSTGFVNGTYVLNGSLPSWGAINNYIEIDTLGWFQIVAITYDETKNADVLLINYAYSGSETVEKVGSIYNHKNYEIYEFDINFYTYEGQELQIELLQNNVVFGDCNYLSEKIHVLETWYDTLELKWYNPTDTFVFYSTGIINKSRVEFIKFEPNNDSDLKIHKTDITTLLISSESYETMGLEIGHLTTSIMRQLSKAFLHKELYIDNVQYVLNSAPDTEPIPFTNLHILKLNLTKTGQVFNSEFSGDIGNTSTGEIIGLLQSTDNYIKLG